MAETYLQIDIENFCFFTNSKQIKMRTREVGGQSEH